MTEAEQAFAALASDEALGTLIVECNAPCHVRVVHDNGVTFYGETRGDRDRRIHVAEFRVFPDTNIQVMVVSRYGHMMHQEILFGQPGSSARVVMRVPGWLEDMRFA